MSNLIGFLNIFYNQNKANCPNLPKYSNSSPRGKKVQQKFCVSKSSNSLKYWKRKSKSCLFQMETKKRFGLCWIVCVQYRKKVKPQNPVLWIIVVSPQHILYMGCNKCPSQRGLLIQFVFYWTIVFLGNNNMKLFHQNLQVWNFNCTIFWVIVHLLNQIFI